MVTSKQLSNCKPSLFLFCVLTLGTINVFASIENSNFDDANFAADRIFFGENIVTMEDEERTVNAVAIKADKIIFVGNRQQARSHINEQTELVELGDKALLPGFIDAHGHFTGTARFINYANLSSPPIGKVSSISDLNNILVDYVKAQEQAPEWIVGYGYDESLLSEGKHPTRSDLDKVSTEIPITVIHVSHHFASINSAALRALKINAQTPNPKGGIIRRQTGSMEPNGVLEESAAYPAFYPLTKISAEEYEQALRDGADYYASFGITSAQDGATSENDIAFLRSITAKKRLPIDLNLYQHISNEDQLESATTESDYQNGIKVAGAKFIVDGSPQGRTAWVSKPYLKNDTNQASDYVAYPTIDINFYQRAISKLLSKNVQVISHANGDAAIDQVLDTLEKVRRDTPNPDHRSVIIHSQLMRKDQISKAKDANAIPSFFSAHPFYWGDWHRLNFGEDRAKNISPLAWAEEENLRFTIHNDAPVVPPDMIRLLWVSTNRLTRSGVVLGEDQRVRTETALRAMTIDAAYQNFEESRKGSITEGKQADFVILSQNPLKINTVDLQDLSVLETIARGKTIFRKNVSD